MYMFNKYKYITYVGFPTLLSEVEVFMGNFFQPLLSDRVPETANNPMSDCKRALNCPGSLQASAFGLSCLTYITHLLLSNCSTFLISKLNQAHRASMTWIPLLTYVF